MNRTELTGGKLNRNAQRIFSSRGGLFFGVLRIHPHKNDVWPKKKRFNVHPGRDFHGVTFETIVDIAKQSESLTVKASNTTGHGLITCASQAIKDLIGTAIDPSRKFTHVTIYTEHVDKIRAQAKELRTDKAVARASKKPTKPKADLKTRKDIF